MRDIIIPDSSPPEMSPTTVVVSCHRFDNGVVGIVGGGMVVCLQREEQGTRHIALRRADADGREGAWAHLNSF